MKIKFSNVFYNMLLIMPALYFAICLFSLNIASKLVLIEIVMSFLYLIHILLKKKDITILTLFLIILSFYAMYVTINEGFTAILHSYFYSYVFMFIMLILCSFKDFRNLFLEWLIKKNNISKFKIYSIILFLLFAVSITFMNGIRTGVEGINYFLGPFSYAHPIAYILLSIYSIAAIYRKFTKEKKFFVIIQILSLVFLLLTGVRSAFLAIVILLFLDICSLKQRKKIYIICFTILMVLFILAINPTFILNNPVFQKTFIAQSNGSVSNGRELYRQISLDYFFSIDDLKIGFFGTGMTDLINNMYAHIGVHIHTHNDYVNLLVAYGYLGFVLMIVCQFISSLNFKSKIYFLGYHAFIFILAYTNGFALYSCMIMSFPFISLYFSQGEIKDIFFELKNYSYRQNGGSTYRRKI